jgi:hypothetical protein
MPAELQPGDAFTELVRARCSQAWLGTTELEDGIPSRHWHHLYKGEAWTAATRTQYDKMVTRQALEGGVSSRREDLTCIFFIHRARLAFSGDGGLALLGKNLAAASAGELLSDFGGKEGAKLGGTRARGDLHMLLAELQRHWAEVLEAVKAERNINTVTIHAIEENIVMLFERRYARFAAVFKPGKVREEVLANTARQCAELRSVIEEFTRDLNHRGAALSYAEQLKFVANRYLTLYSPIMKTIDGSETGAVPGGVSVHDIRDSDPRPSQEAKTRRVAARIEIPTAVEPNQPAASLQPSGNYDTWDKWDKLGWIRISRISRIRLGYPHGTYPEKGVLILTNYPTWISYRIS